MLFVTLYICHMTKQIRISEKVHTKLKIHVAKKKGNIIEFADRALKDAMELDRLREKNLKAMK